MGFNLTAPNPVVLEVLLLLFGIISIYILAKTCFIKKAKWLAITGMLFAFLCALTFSIWAFPAFHYAHQLFIASLWFILGGILFILSIILLVNHKANAFDKLCSAFIVGVVPYFFLLGGLFFELFTNVEIVSRLHLSGNVYLEMYSNDGQMCYDLQTENYLLFEKSHTIYYDSLDPYSTLDSFRITDFRNNLLDADFFQQKRRVHVHVDLNED